MADIKKELNDIKNAVYGREVRGSIHDGIKKINDEVENATDLSESAKHQVENIQQQVNQLVVEGDSSVEAAQARVDAEGKSFPTLKARLDEKETQFSSHLAQIDDKIKSREVNINDFPKMSGEIGDTERIQRAINSLGQDGGVVFFPSGYYELTHPITFDARSLTLKGIGRKSRLSPSDNFEGDALIRSLADEDRTNITALESVIIEKLHLHGRRQEISGIKITGFTRGCVIRDNTINEVNRGIELSGSWSFSIERNNMNGIDKNGSGIYLGEGDTGFYNGSAVVNQARIVGNTVRRFGVGCHVGYGNNNTIIGNTFEINDRDITSLASRSLVVIGNYLEGAESWSVQLGGVSNTVEDSLFMGNFFNAGIGHEIYVVGLTNSTIEKNQFYSDRKELVIPQTRGVITGNIFEAVNVDNYHSVSNENILINYNTKHVSNIKTDSINVDLTSVRKMRTIANGLEINGESPLYVLSGIPQNGEDGSTGEIRFTDDKGVTIARIGKISSSDPVFFFRTSGFMNGFRFDGDIGFFGTSPKSKQSVTGTTDTEKLDSLINALKTYGLID